MKSLLVSLFIFGVLSATAQVERKQAPPEAVSQTDKPAKPSAKTTLREQLKQLDLTRKQQVQLKNLRQEQQSKKATIENNEQLSDTEKKKQLRVLQQEQFMRIQSILTEAQKEKLKQLRQAAEVGNDDKDG